jgi:hypothetical protein
MVESNSSYGYEVDIEHRDSIDKLQVNRSKSRSLTLILGAVILSRCEAPKALFACFPFDRQHPSSPRSMNTLSRSSRRTSSLISRLHPSSTRASSTLSSSKKPVASPSPADVTRGQRSLAGSSSVPHDIPTDS